MPGTKRKYAATRTPLKSKYSTKSRGANSIFRTRARGQAKASNATTGFVRSPEIVPDRMFAKIKYNEIVSFTSGTYFGTYVFSGNDVRDPNESSTGTQPTGFDQWMAFYSKFRVIASSIKVTMSSQSGTKSQIIAVLPVNDYSTITGINESVRDPRAVTGMIAASGNNVLTIDNYCTSKKIFGENDLSGDAFTGTSSLSPDNEWYWVIAGANCDGSGTLANQMHVALTYYVEFLKRKDLATS